MNRRISRCGFTLIELIAVLAVVATIVSLSSVLLFLILDSSTKSREQADYRNARERLLAVFRSDVKLFGTPTIDVQEENADAAQDGNRTIARWETPTGILTYQLVPSNFGTSFVERLLNEEGKTVPDREKYIMPENIRIDIYEGTGENQQLVALSIWKSPNSIQVNKADLNPFNGELSTTIAQQIDPKFAGNWRTAIVRSPQTLPRAGGVSPPMPRISD